MAKIPQAGAAPPSTAILILVVLTIIAGLASRLYKLDAQSMECEELYTLPVATGHYYRFYTTPPEARLNPVPTAIEEYKQLLTPSSEKGLIEVTKVLSRNVHMPLYFYFMHYWIKLNGTSTWAVRLPSVIFGTITILIVFLLGKAIANQFIGFLGALLMALMPDQIHFSQQARMYPLLVLLVASSTYVILIIRKRPSLTYYILYAIISVAGVYTHYAYIICFLSQSLYVWIVTLPERDKIRPWLITQLSIIALCLPWALIGLTQTQTSAEAVAWIYGVPPDSWIPREVLSKVTSLISVPELPNGWLSVIVAYVFLALGVKSLFPNRHAAIVLCMWIAVPIAGILFMDRVPGTNTISVTRYWMVITPALYLLIAAGIQRVSVGAYRIPLVTSIAACLLIGAAWTANGQLRRKSDDHFNLSRFIDNNIQGPEQEFILSEGSNAIPLALAYYGRQKMNILQYGWVVDEQKPPRYLEIMNTSRSVLLATSGGSKAIKALEESGFQRIAGPARFGHVSVYRYVKQGASQSMRGELQIRLKNHEVTELISDPR